MNLFQLSNVKTLFESAGVEIPPPILRGLELIQVAEQHDTPPGGGLLDLSDEEARDRVTDLSIRQHYGNAVSSRGMKAGIEVFKSELAIEIREASMPYLEQIILDLKARFEELSAPLVTAAQRYGFTTATTSDQVIDLADEKASAAWREGRAAWYQIGSIVQLRKEISKAFDVSPTREEGQRLFWNLDMEGELDYSVCFAAGDNWSTDGAYYVDRKTAASIDWYALAAGGLRLNTPAEVRAKQASKSGRELSA